LRFQIDGAVQEVEVVRQERRLGGTQGYWICPRCGDLRSHLFIVPDGAGARRCAAAFVVGSPTARAMSRVRWLARRSCGVGSVVRPVYCRRCRESLDIGARSTTGG